MSKIAIKGNVSGTATFTIEAPNSNTDRTLNLPDEAGTILTSGGAIADALDVDSAPTDSLEVDSSSNLKFNSGYGSVATAYGCRAWVNFNGTSTVSIRASGGVSSITDNGTGDYTINLSTTMPDANYNAVAMGRTWPGVQSEGFVVAFGNYAGDGTTGRTSSSLRISTLNQTTAKGDSPYVGVSFFR